MNGNYEQYRGPARERVCGYLIVKQPGKTMVFGGHNHTTELGDTWELDGIAWNQVHTGDPIGITAPTARYSAALAYDNERDRTVLFSGGYYGGENEGDTWEYGLCSQDCNVNNIPDECELADNDCNLNDTPDECDPDCNGKWNTPGLYFLRNLR